jgi:cytoskeletal protein CcmA (bactofilin family)
MNVKTTFITSALVALFIALPATSFAASVVRTGDSVSVEKDQRIEGNFYTAASILNISGEITGDLAAVGGKNTLNGTVAKDALLAGGNVDVHGAIGEDLRIIAGDTVIAEPVTGDVFVMGGTVKVLSTASIGGDLIVYAGDVEVSGSVGGNIIGTVSTLRVDAPVAGNIDVTTTALTLGDRADVTGTVRYVSASVLTRAQNAKVGGEISRSDKVVTDSSAGVKAVLVPILMLLFSTLIWYLIARRFLIKIINRALVRGIRPFATGFIAFFAAPLIAVILIVSVLGSFVGITALIAYIFALLLAVVSGVAVLGQFIVLHTRKGEQPLSPLSLAIGVLAATLLAFVPLLGPILLLTLFLVTLGAIVDLLLHPEA